MPDPDEVDGSLSTKLGRFVLISHASGVDVEGEWRFVDTDAIIPNFVAVVTRIDEGSTTVLDANQVTVGLRDPERFKEIFYDILLEAYASGTDVAGSYRLKYAAAELPRWIVHVETDGRDSDVDGDRLRRTS